MATSTNPPEGSGPGQQPAAASVVVDAIRGGAAAVQVRLEEPGTSSGANGKAKDASSEKATGGWSTVLDWLIKLVPATAGALGLVGFVGATGAALTWWRFWTAGLPANQALKAVPLDERLITGAGALMLFLILGGVAAAVIYSIDQPGRPTGPMRQGLGALVTVEVLVAIWATAILASGQLTDEAVLASIVIIGWAALGFVMTYDPSGPDGKGTYGSPYTMKRQVTVVYKAGCVITWPLRWFIAPFAVMAELSSAEQATPADVAGGEGFWRRVKQKARQGLCPVSPQAERLPLSDEELQRWLDAQHVGQSPTEEPTFAPDEKHEIWRVAQPFRWLRRVSGFGFLCAGFASVVAIALLWVATDDWVIPACFIAACGLAALIFGVCRATDAFWPYGVSVFLSVALFGTFVEAALLAHQPQAQAVAVVNTAGRGVSGLYVADAKDGIWLAPHRALLQATCDPTPAHGSASIVLIPRKEIARYAIGGPRKLCVAVGQEQVLLRDLQRAFPPTPKNP